MKRHTRIVITAVLLLILVGGVSYFLIGPHSAGACGYGSSGGKDYVPQRQGGADNYMAEKSAISVEQAREIVANHINKLNPDLKVGNINDAGSFFEAEILSKDKEIIQLLGVDKFSGRLMLLN